jgi:general secretion pathway protein K
MVALAASLAAQSMWQQWQLIEAEQAERQRQQAAGVLHGALDWARLILREDGRSGGPDHLGEPWAVPLAEARLSSFLAADRNADTRDEWLAAFLQGRILDAQAKLNLANLVDTDAVSEPALRSTERLLSQLGLNTALARTLADGLRRAQDAARAGAAAATPGPLVPQRLQDLAWLGVDTATLERLAPYATLLPVRTPLNLNTASATVLMASIPGLTTADARRLTEGRALKPFRSISEAQNLIQREGVQFSDTQHAVASRFFEVHARLRLDTTTFDASALVQRDGMDVRVLWRRRGGGPVPP